MKRGRPKIFETPEQLWETFLDYVKQTKASPFLVHDFVGGEGRSVERKKEKPLTIEGFTNYLWFSGIMLDPKDYFSNKDGRYNDFIPICTRIRDAVRQDQIEGGMAGIYNPSITQRLNNLVEQTNNKHDVNTITVKHER